jgi:hypothetical protein
MVQFGQHLVINVVGLVASVKELFFTAVRNQKYLKGRLDRQGLGREFGYPFIVAPPIRFSFVPQLNRVGVSMVKLQKAVPHQLLIILVPSAVRQTRDIFTSFNEDLVAAVSRGRPDRRGQVLKERLFRVTQIIAPRIGCGSPVHGTAESEVLIDFERVHE